MEDEEVGVWRWRITGWERGWSEGTGNNQSCEIRMAVVSMKQKVSGIFDRQWKLGGSVVQELDFFFCVDELIQRPKQIKFRVTS